MVNEKDKLLSDLINSADRIETGKISKIAKGDALMKNFTNIWETVEELSWLDTVMGYVDDRRQAKIDEEIFQEGQTHNPDIQKELQRINNFGQQGMYFDCLEIIKWLFKQEEHVNFLTQSDRIDLLMKGAQAAFKSWEENRAIKIYVKQLVQEKKSFSPQQLWLFNLLVGNIFYLKAKECLLSNPLLASTYFEKAMEYFEQVKWSYSTLDPHALQCLLSLQSVHRYHQKNYEQSLMCLNKYFKLQSGDLNKEQFCFLFLKAVLLAKLEKYPEAIQVMKQYILKNPKDMSAKKILGQWLDKTFSE